MLGNRTEWYYRVRNEFHTRMPQQLNGSVAESVLSPSHNVAIFAVTQVGKVLATRAVRGVKHNWTTGHFDGSTH